MTLFIQISLYFYLFFLTIVFVNITTEFTMIIPCIFNNCRILFGPKLISARSEKNTLIHSVQSGHLTYKMILTKSTLLMESNRANSTENPREKKIKTKCFTNAVLPSKPCQNCALNTIHYGKYVNIVF